MSILQKLNSMNDEEFICFLDYPKYASVVKNTPYLMQRLENIKRYASTGIHGMYEKEIGDLHFLYSLDDLGLSTAVQNPLLKSYASSDESLRRRI